MRRRGTRSRGHARSRSRPEREARNAAGGPLPRPCGAEEARWRTPRSNKAEAVYNDLDGQINDLEKLYAAVTSGLDKEQTAPLLSLMKATRQATGQFFLAYEQQDYETALEREQPARQAVEAARKTLESARSH